LRIKLKKKKNFFWGEYLLIYFYKKKIRDDYKSFFFLVGDYKSFRKRNLYEERNKKTWENKTKANKPLEVKEEGKKTVNRNPP